MPKIVPFSVNHLDVMDLRDIEAGIVGIKEYRDALDATPFACTGIEDGRLICCGGVIPTLRGGSTIWLVPSTHITKCTKTFVKELRGWLFGLREDLALHRMETDCIADDLHDRWMRSLGFQEEGVKRKYHNGKDYRVWGRIWE